MTYFRVNICNHPQLRWVASSTAGLLLYVLEDRVYCVFCKEALKATTISTLKNHCTLRKNKKRPVAAAGAGAGGAGAGAKRKQRTARMLCKHEINVQNALQAKAKKAKLLAGLGAVVSEKKYGSGASNKDLALNLRGSLTASTSSSTRCRASSRSRRSGTGWRAAARRRAAVQRAAWCATGYPL